MKLGTVKTTVRYQNSGCQNSVLLTIFGKNVKNRQKRIVVSLIGSYKHMMFQNMISACVLILLLIKLKWLNYVSQEIDMIQFHCTTPDSFFENSTKWRLVLAKSLSKSWFFSQVMLNIFFSTNMVKVTHLAAEFVLLVLF